MRILFFGNQYKNTYNEKIEILLKKFLAIGADICVEEKFYNHLIGNVGIDFTPKRMITDEDYDGDIAISLGGDGTFLNTAAKIGCKNIPILGINMGRLGFLAEANCDNIDHIISQIVNKDYDIEERLVLQLMPSEPIKNFNLSAINEIAILKQDQSSMISIATTVNGEYLNTYQADGLIISTPTGSTAYSMSVGGPILVPEAKNLILAPVASHSLTVRPLLIPDDWKIELSVKSRSRNYLIALDGRSVLLPLSTRLTITKADYTMKLIKTKDSSFFKALKSKLMWGVDVRE